MLVTNASKHYPGEERVIAFDETEVATRDSIYIDFETR